MRPALSNATGVGMYLVNLVDALSRIDENNEYLLFSSSWKERYPSVHYPGNFKAQDFRWPVRVLNYCWNHLSHPHIEFLLHTPVDIVHSPTPLVIPSRGARIITTVHDLYFYTHPADAVREMKNVYPNLVKKHCLRSDAIIAVSDYTKRQLVEILQVPSSQIYTIRHGSDPYFLEQATTSEKTHVLSRFKIRSPFFLFVGTQEPRKNLATLIRAFLNLREEPFLVIAGPKGWGPDFGKEFSRERIVMTEYVSKRDLRALYQQATAVVFPSFDEGFGLPLLEGMSSGIPVLASRIPAFQEVCNNSCLYFDPANVEELTEKMEAVFHQTDLRNTLIAKGKERVKHFSWKETAQKTLDLYMSL